MSYGLDLDDVRYEIDRHGNRTGVIVPVPMFNALTEFWRQVRRAHTAQLEAKTRPGMYKGSFDKLNHAGGSAPVEDNNEHAELDAPTGRFGRAWSALLDRMPDAALPDMPVEVATPQSDETCGDQASHDARLSKRIFPREFEESPPEEVAARIRNGVYFLRAWREYRRLTLRDVADLFGKTIHAVQWHEFGRSRPKPETLAHFAEVFDCPLAQLTPKVGSDMQPWAEVADDSGPDVRQKVEPRAPDDTDYPDAVLAHMIAGKTPLIAWRLHRHLTIAELAEQYGCSAQNIKALESMTYLKQRTIAKLCPILHCTPLQLLRPESLSAPEKPIRHRSTVQRRRRIGGVQGR